MMEGWEEGTQAGNISSKRPAQLIDIYVDLAVAGGSVDGWVAYLALLLATRYVY